MLDVIYPGQQFLSNNFFNTDDDRNFINNGCGNYSSATQRATMAASANSYFVQLKTFINQSHMTLMNASPGLQLRVFMDTQANCIIQGAT